MVRTNEWSLLSDDFFCVSEIFSNSTVVSNRNVHAHSQFKPLFSLQFCVLLWPQKFEIRFLRFKDFLPHTDDKICQQIPNDHLYCDKFKYFLSVIMVLWIIVSNYTKEVVFFKYVSFFTMNFDSGKNLNGNYTSMCMHITYSANDVQSLRSKVRDGIRLLCLSIFLLHQERNRKKNIPKY